MKRLIYCTIVAFLSAFSLQAQYETVVLNYEKSYFGENELLPANKFFMMKGMAAENTKYIELSLYQADDINEEDPLYTTFWKRDQFNSSSDFNIPVNYKLEEGEEYDFYIQYFREISEKEMKVFRRKLSSNLDSYIDLAVEPKEDEIEFVRKEKQIVADLNNIVEQSMKYYRTKTRITWTGFSDVIRLQLEQLDGQDFKNVKADSLNEANAMTKNSRLDALKKNIRAEVETYLNAEMFILEDDKLIQDYPVEKVDGRYYLAPHVGYGGAMLNFDSDDFNYASGFYAGLSFPLASQSKNNFLSRTSVNVGAFLGKIEDVDENKIGGPLFNIPTYVSLGYRPFAFIRVQAGATFLENANGDAVISGFENDVKIAPFIGISAEFNMFFNLEK